MPIISYTSIDLSSEMPPFVEWWKDVINDEVASLSSSYTIVYLCRNVCCIQDFSSSTRYTGLSSLLAFVALSSSTLQWQTSQYVFRNINFYSGKQNNKEWLLIIFHCSLNTWQCSKTYRMILMRKLLLRKQMLKFLCRSTGISKLEKHAILLE